jgi:MFS family permease
MGDVVGSRGGTVVAVFQMSGDLGAVLGPILAGWIADWQGYAAAFAVSAAISLAPIPFVLAAPETLRPDRTAADGAGESAIERPPSGAANPPEAVAPDVG